MLEIRLLGPLEVRDDDEVVDLRRRKQRALLAALALRAGEPVSTDRLVDELWGEHAPKTAKHALENYVSDLRKLLGRDVIGTASGGYVLAIEPGQVDVARFERLVAEGRGEPVAERAEKLRAALALVRGQPLADLAFEPFAQAEVARLLELELAAREDLLDAELELGRHAQAVVAVEPLVAAHPYRERLRAQLMLALYRSGRQADALATYQDARRILVDELGIDPGEELQELQRAILRQDPALRAPSTEPRRATRKLPEAAAVRAGRRTVTILAFGLANEADLSDRLDPEQLRAVLDRYLEQARKTVEVHGGFWQSHGGRGVVAIFGIPLAHEDDALRAVRAAVDLREAVSVLNDGLLPEHGVFLELRSAVATGEVLVQPEADEIATGRPLSVARRLEEVARPGQILVGEETRRLVRDTVIAEPLEEGDGAAFRLVELRDMHGRALRLESPLVGRRRQLAALASAFESAVSERTLHLFTVLGPAGVGKSRLVEEFLASLAGVASVHRGRCLPYGEPAKYRPLHEAGIADADDVEPATLRAALAGRARERPLVLALDDVQWASAALLDLVEDLAETVRESPVLVLCSARLELLEARPAWGGGKPNATSFLLEPLTEAESERLLDNLLGESEVPDAVRDWLVRTSEGNPLFVEELLATLVERDILTREAGRWTTTQVPAIPIPPTVQALVAARIDRLPDDEQRLLELASIEGKHFVRDVVVALADERAAGEVDELLAALVRKELVRPIPDAPGGFSFRHQLIRDAAYASLPKSLRAELHDRLATWAEGANAELAASHRAQADGYRVQLGPV